MHAWISCFGPCVHASILTLLSSNFDEHNRVFFSSFGNCAVCMVKFGDHKSSVFVPSGMDDDGLIPAEVLSEFFVLPSVFPLNCLAACARGSAMHTEIGLYGSFKPCACHSNQSSELLIDNWYSQARQVLWNLWPYDNDDTLTPYRASPKSWDVQSQWIICPCQLSGGLLRWIVHWYNLKESRPPNPSLLEKFDWINGNTSAPRPNHRTRRMLSSKDGISELLWKVILPRPCLKSRKWQVNRAWLEHCTASPSSLLLCISLSNGGTIEGYRPKTSFCF